MPAGRREAGEREGFIRHIATRASWVPGKAGRDNEDGGPCRNAGTRFMVAQCELNLCLNAAVYPREVSKDPEPELE